VVSIDLNKRALVYGLLGRSIRLGALKNPLGLGSLALVVTNTLCLRLQNFRYHYNADFHKKVRSNLIFLSILTFLFLAFNSIDSQLFNSIDMMSFKRLLIILHAILIPICCVSQNINNSTPKKTLKILSWNIYMLPYFIFSASNKADRAKGIVEEVKKRDYDIIVFQEAFKTRPRNILSKGLEELYPYQYGPANKKAMTLKTNSGIWVVSKIPLKSLGSIRFSNCTGIDCMARKGALLLEGEIHNNTFQILGTHANSGPEPEERRAQFKMIYDELLQPNQKQGIPQIVVGDMNCRMSSQENYSKMLKLMDVEDTPLNGTRRHSNWEKTKIIDYIFIRKNGCVNMLQQHKEITQIGPDWDTSTPDRNKGDNGLGLSDHSPVEVIYSFEQ